MIFHGNGMLYQSPPGEAGQLMGKTTRTLRMGSVLEKRSVHEYKFLMRT